MSKSLAWEVIGTAIIVFAGMFMYWVSNDDIQCRYATSKMRAFGMCLLDEGCIRTPEDYSDINYWTNVKHDMCGEEDEEELVEPTGIMGT